MTTTTKVAAAGTTLSFQTGGTSGSPTYTVVAGFKGFSDLYGGTRATIDVTDLSSTSREYLAGIKDGGSFKADFIYVEGDAGQAALEAALSDPTAKSVKLTTSTGSTFVFNAVILTFPLQGAEGAAFTRSATLQVSGDIAFTAAS